MSLSQLNLIKHVLSVNAPRHTERPKSSRWNRNYTAIAEYWFHWHNTIYPVPESDLYLQHSVKMIPVPQLVFRRPEVQKIYP